MSLWKKDCILLGHQGSSGEPLDILVDMSKVLAVWPDAYVDIIVIRPGEDSSHAYMADCCIEGQTLIWHVSAADTELAGYGSAEIVVTKGTDIVLSCVVKTKIRPNIGGLDLPDPPEPAEGWVQTVIDAKNAVMDADAEVSELAIEIRAKHAAVISSAEAAEEAAATATEMADAAAESERMAKLYADMAEADVKDKGVFWLDIDEHGTLWYHFTNDLAEDLTFEMDDGDPAGTLYAVINLDEE